MRCDDDFVSFALFAPPPSLGCTPAGGGDGAGDDDDRGANIHTVSLVSHLHGAPPCVYI